MAEHDPALVEQAAEAMVHLRWPTTEPIQAGDREVARTMLDAVVPAIREAALNDFADRFRPGDGNPWALHVRARARRMAAQQRQEQADGLE